MKKIFEALLLLIVICFSACSEMEVIEESSLEKDLNLVATKAMASVQPFIDWNKIFRPNGPVLPPVVVDSLAVDITPTPPPAPIEEVIAADIENKIEDFSYLLEKYGKLDELNIFDEIDNMEEFIGFDEEGIVNEVNYDSLLFVCTTDRFNTILYNIKNSDAPSISQIAADESLKLVEKIFLAELIGSYYQLEEELDLVTTKGNGYPGRVPYGYSLDECDEKYGFMKRRCQINYDRDKAIWTGVSAIMAGGCSSKAWEAIAHFVGHEVVDHAFFIGKQLEERKQRCIQSARNWWGDCVANANH